MPPRNWKIIDNCLCISSQTSVYYPSAEEIYLFLNNDLKDADHTLIEAGDPRTSFPQVRFSGLGFPFKCILSSDESGKLRLSLFVPRKGELVPVHFINGKVIDHCVFNNIWFQVTGNIPYIEETLSKAGVTSDGEISIRQYVKIIECESFAEVPSFENTVDFSKFKAKKVPAADVPVNLNASLFPYQKTGYEWIKFMLDSNGGCILGDEMGLGKTMQVIATILDLKARGQVPVLVVAPVSLLINWQRECAKFAPTLDVYIHHGGNRTGDYKNLLVHDVIVTAYSTVVSDVYMLKMVDWSFVALDEAQNIKNPYSARTKACKQLKAQSNIAVTGTPFENHVSDIWSILDFIMPGVFGSLQMYQSKITDDSIGGSLIEPVLSPLMIRRMVSDVAQDLPEKVISTQPIQMSEEEADAYFKYLNEIKSEMGTEEINIGMLQKLRMYCTHPFIITGDSPCLDPSKYSIKYQRFLEILEEVIARNEKMLVFTSYKKMFDIFKEDIGLRFNIPLFIINGETPVEDRQNIVDTFNGIVGSAVMILNPRAAGTGLNITGANHVVHYNFEWNPSLEDQSSARAYRRGQNKTVFIYRLYYVDTVEQVVNERIERKRDTASSAIVGNSGINLDKEDLLRALELYPKIKK